ncbi:RNA methyltransferase [Cytobacillus firmus]|uniref:23S rRNA (uracil(1939)-C(5))-methyltransferase RlmD n=1 Tax=Cytobacillus firmus TaxID=1399 RepID=UPI000E152C1D|nr:23S rRNA (uracil(1939)-C(5))-methyltransferase RlmD [Cytobacillus firmus]MBG9544294.1 RNA methyltransferase [Cytobacillus firmus]MBG9554741.1 RNA methyltransferase [Cytobacillus firmus]MBG9559028.1 RNA methyltransferase [Cytobacillus firmus]MEC1893525.1 23S rRNA (uracil(1939)-C(5))-methyltransferase RlmD [Cytobacillus firmus]MED4451690.1 23S rRNA (uracil(1939)-C(5))-methyltransferase RlmD [Cytobacillus firmus]
MKQEQTAKLKPKQTFPLTIKRLGINGEGVGYFKRQVVFVPGALPGEEIVAEATKVNPKFSEAKIKKIRKKSEFRVQPPCPVYHECGGCQLQHLRYDQQLKEKRDIIIQALERHTKLNPEKLDIKETIGMEDPWSYRNKSQFQVGQKDGKVLAGLYGMNSHRLINIEHCAVQHPQTTKATETVKRILQDLRIPIYNERNRKGIVRTIVARVGIQTGELQIVLITAQKELPKKEIIIEKIKSELPEVKSIIQNVNGEKTSIIFGQETMNLDGSDFIQETLGDLQFELSARTFFQLNPEQTVKLYNEVKRAAGLTGKEKVADAYCGVGTIGLWVADQAAEIRGMDIIRESIEDAKKNAARHGIKHAQYVVGKAEEWLPKWTKEGWKPDVIIVDPPRTGLDQQLLKTILKVQPKKVVYVSCNPSTLAKDISVLSSKYHVSGIQPVDMFPQTAHVECISQLVLKND